jgi:hypothetical protein
MLYSLLVAASKDFNSVKISTSSLSTVIKVVVTTTPRVAIDPRMEFSAAYQVFDFEARLPIPAGILRIPVFSAPVVFFSEDSQFLFCHNFFGTPSGNLSVWGLHRKLCRISNC